MNRAGIEMTAPCHTCKLKDICDVLKIYQVVVYECVYSEYESIEKLEERI